MQVRWCTRPYRTKADQREVRSIRVSPTVQRTCKKLKNKTHVAPVRLIRPFLAARLKFEKQVLGALRLGARRERMGQHHREGRCEADMLARSSGVVEV